LYSFFLLFLPTLNDSLERVNEYGTTQINSSINEMGFYQIYPPLLFIFLMYVVFLIHQSKK
jgi:hypothetical protein